MTTRRSFLKTSSLTAVAGLGGVAEAVFANTTLPSAWDLSTEIVVAGSGPAGMGAAVTAIDNNAKVLIFEKGKNYGGCGVISAGILKLEGGTRSQKAAGIQDSVEQYYKRLTNPNEDLSRAERMGNQELLVKKVERTAAFEDWAINHGVKFRPGLTTAGVDSQHPGMWHHVWWKDGGEGRNMIPPNKDGYVTGAGLMLPLKEYFESKGGRIYLEHKVTSVIKDANGRVIGVEVLSPDGKILKVRATKGVVLAGGGFKGNVPMRMLFDARMTKNMIATGEPFVFQDGSAIKVGVKAGGFMVRDGNRPHSNFRRKFGTIHYNFPLNSPYGAPGLDVAGNRWNQIIFTNKNGDRFVQEVDKWDLGTGYNFYDLALAQPDQLIWTIFDDATAKKYRWSTKPPVCEDGLAFDANTLDELGKLTNQPNLAQTVERYNNFVDTKADSDFGRPAATMTKKIEKAPFHAVRCVLAVHNISAGLAINGDGQVIDIDLQPIPGLYAAGESAGGIGGGVTGSMIVGQIAAEHLTNN